MGEVRRSNAGIACKLALIVVGMFGFGYLMVPIYNVLCEVTGLNGKTGVIDASDANVVTIDNSREITVEFIASLGGGASWEFKPDVTRMMVHPGQTYTTTYYARNTTAREVIGQAVPSVTPHEASRYFKKTECFCFSRQHFAANEMRHMPLVFIIDPEIPRTVNTVTLSYTFFDIDEQVGS